MQPTAIIASLLAPFMVATLLVGCSPSPSPHNSEQQSMTSEDPMLALRSDYLRFITSAQTADFRPVPASGPATMDAALFASVSWCRLVFRDAVHGPGDQAQHWYHLASRTLPADLLLHRLTIGAVGVRVY